jgi:photosystem II stability/assembly factor-like uncharacterized protein
MGIDRPAKIYRTEDGGATWKETYHNDEPGIFLDGLAFFDDRSGLAVGDPMGGRLFVLTTEDGGRSWQPLPLADRPAAVEGEGVFAASGTSLAGQGRSMAWIATGGPVTRVWRSTDKGRHWEEAASPLLSGQPSLGTFSVAFLDERNGLLVGGDYRNETADAGNAAFSVDGGRTWSAGPGRRPGGFRECVAFVPGTSPRMAVTVGPSGSDYSLDRGRTWAPMPGPEGFHSASFARTGKTGWAVGKGGLIARFAFSE